MSTVKLTYREAVRAGLRHVLATDERVFLMGEDVGGYGGAFAVSLGLLDEFGPERVRNTPLSESGFVGAGIGAALDHVVAVARVDAQMNPGTVLPTHDCGCDRHSRNV